MVPVVAADGSLGLPESVSQHDSRSDELRASAGLLGRRYGLAPAARCFTPVLD